MPLFKVTGYPDEENIYHQHHTKIETWIVEARDENEALRLGIKHFYYFHELNVSEYTPCRVKLKVGDVIQINDLHRNEIITAEIVHVGDDNDTRYRWSRPSTIFGTITNEEILYDWMIEQGRLLTVNGRKVK